MVTDQETKALIGSLEAALEDINGVRRVLEHPLIPSERPTVRAMLDEACGKLAGVRDVLRTS